LCLFSLLYMFKNSELPADELAYCIAFTKNLPFKGMDLHLEQIEKAVFGGFNNPILLFQQIIVILAERDQVFLSLYKPEVKKLFMIIKMMP